MIEQANWIRTAEDYGTAAPVFKKHFAADKPIEKANLYITAMGVYKAEINNKIVGNYVMAPGFTSYKSRLQYQKYDVTEKIEKNNVIEVTVGNGWYSGRLGWSEENKIWAKNVALIACIEIIYKDKTKEIVLTDESWQTSRSKILFSEIYDGEIYDANADQNEWNDCVICKYGKDTLIPQEGEEINEIERLNAVEIIITPKGETVIDFGQNITGYVEFHAYGLKNNKYILQHAEVLDQEGNFYTENLRSAKQEIVYISDGKPFTYKPSFTFQGFRYIKLINWNEKVSKDNFTAISVHSNIQRTGYIETSNKKINKLFSNIIWGQRDNFLDIPTDCPQRDERLGWTGDVQAFVKTAAYNFNVYKFFKKWLNDLKAEQFEDGGIPAVIPDVLNGGCASSSGWGDVATVCPWQLYLTYGEKEILENQYDSMAKWVEYISKQGENEFLWNTGHHFGDWLNQDKNYTDRDVNLIATAFYAYSTSILIKTSKILGKDTSEYERLFEEIKNAYISEFIRNDKLVCQTQTAHVLTLKFNLYDNKKVIADNLVKLIKENGNKLATGFLGTPFLMEVLSENGYADVAYTLLFQEECPSWLYQVNNGATTMWERWDGIKPDKSFNDAGMNSFNHYAYGAVGSFLYETAAGINTDENNPGFKNIIFKPIITDKLDFVNASINTKYGEVKSSWSIRDGKVKFEFTVPEECTAVIVLGDDVRKVKEGNYSITKQIKDIS